MTLLVQFASRNRPQRFGQSIHSIFKLAMEPDDILIHAVVDEDDEYLVEYKSLIAVHERTNQIFTSVGLSKSKIDAINRPLPAMRWDVLINFSDDMRFTVMGWDRLIKEGVRCNCENRPGFLHYPEKDSGLSIAPMSVLTHDYYDIDGYIYHPSYVSLWCDNEALEVAKIRNMYYYMGELIYQHLNPAYGHLDRDELFDVQQRWWGVDEETFYERKAKNFDLNPDDYDS